MKKKFSSLFIFSLIVFSISSAQSLTPVVISSAGSFASAGGFSLSSTTGEVATTTLTAANNFLTQGFQQPQIHNTFVVSLNQIPFTVDVYPNPANENSIVTVTGDNIPSLDVSLYDLLGRKIQTAVRINNSNAQQFFSFNLNSIPPSLYFVRITDLDGNEFATVKLNKS